MAVFGYVYLIVLDFYAAVSAVLCSVCVVQYVL